MITKKLQNFDRLMSALTDFERCDETWKNLERFELQLCIYTYLEYAIGLDFLIDNKIVTIHPSDLSCKQWLKDVHSLLNQNQKDYIVKWLESNLEIF